MSIFRAATKQSAITPDYTGLQIQTAVNALPVPIVWGEFEDRAERHLVQ